MKAKYWGSRALCTEAQRLFTLGMIQYPLVPMTYRRWMTNESGVGKKYSNVPEERDFAFPVPKAFVKTGKRFGVPVYYIHEKYVYILIAWQNARRGGNVDFIKYSKQLESFAKTGQVSSQPEKANG